MSGVLAAILSRAQAVLLDFDGPITALMPPPANAQAAECARGPLRNAGILLPDEVDETTDHLAVLRYSAGHHPDLLDHVESACIAVELLATTTAAPTPGLVAFLRACRSRRLPVVVVSNNAAEPITAFLTRRHLDGHVHLVVGRPRARPELMKPDPHLVDLALRGLADASVLDNARCVMIGDSPSDVAAAHARSVPAIGYARTRRKAELLEEAGAEVVTRSLITLAHALSD